MTSYHTVKYTPCGTSQQSHWLMRRYLDDSCLVVAPSVFRGPNSFAHYMVEYSRQVSPWRSASERNHVSYSDLRLVCLQPPKSRVSVHLIVQYIVHSYKICSKCVHIDKHNISYKPFFGVKKYKTLSSFLPCQTYTHAVRFGAPQGRSPVAVSSATLYACLWNRGMFAAHAPWKNVRWKFGHLQIHWNYSDPLRYMANR